MDKKTISAKYIYYFRGTLRSHVHFFQSRVDALRKEGIPIELLTFLNIKTYIKQYALVKKYRSSYFHIYPVIHSKASEWVYFFALCLLNKKVIVQLKKRSPELFDKLKKVFSLRIKYIVESEGDSLSERDYLSAPYGRCMSCSQLIVDSINGKV